MIRLPVMEAEAEAAATPAAAAAAGIAAYDGAGTLAAAVRGGGAAAGSGTAAAAHMTRAQALAWRVVDEPRRLRREQLLHGGGTPGRQSRARLRRKHQDRAVHRSKIGAQHPPVLGFPLEEGIVLRSTVRGGLLARHDAADLRHALGLVVGQRRLAGPHDQKSQLASDSHHAKHQRQHEEPQHTLLQQQQSRQRCKSQQQQSKQQSKLQEQLLPRHEHQQLQRSQSPYHRPGTGHDDSNNDSERPRPLRRTQSACGRRRQPGGQAAFASKALGEQVTLLEALQPGHLATGNAATFRGRSWTDYNADPPEERGRALARCVDFIESRVQAVSSAEDDVLAKAIAFVRQGLFSNWFEVIASGSGPESDCAQMQPKPYIELTETFDFRLQEQEKENVKLRRELAKARAETASLRQDLQAQSRIAQAAVEERDELKLTATEQVDYIQRIRRDLMNNFDDIKAMEAAKDAATDKAKRCEHQLAEAERKLVQVSKVNEALSSQLEQANGTIQQLEDKMLSRD